jgi:uncharacterized RDD family membrane protein YckC
MFTILGADGKEYGPVTTGNVSEWIRDGRANLVTKARRKGEEDWKPLGEFVEFGGRPAAPSASLFPATIPLTAPLLPTGKPDLEIASRWLRLPAAMIDGLLKSLCYLPISLPLARVVFSEAMSGEARSFEEMSKLTSQVVSDHVAQALPYLVLLMLAQLALLAWRGQSIGKFLIRIRIVRAADGALPGAYHAFLLRGSVPFMIEQIPIVGFAFWLVDSCFIFRRDHRCLHDLIAGTKVVAD